MGLTIDISDGRSDLETEASVVAGAHTGECLGGGRLSPIGGTDSKGGQFLTSAEFWGWGMDIRWSRVSGKTRVSSSPMARQLMTAANQLRGLVQ